METKTIKVRKRDTSITFSVDGKDVANLYPKINKGKVESFSIMIKNEDISLSDPQNLNSFCNMINYINSYSQKVNLKFKGQDLLLLSEADIDEDIDFI